MNHALDIGYKTYKLHLVDGYNQHVDVDVSVADFHRAKFDECAAFDVARIRKHYSVSVW